MATATEEYRSLVSEFLPRPIRSEREYRRALAYIDRHLRPKLKGGLRQPRWRPLEGNGPTDALKPAS